MEMGGRLLTIATQIMVMSIIIAAVVLFVGIGVLVFLHICIVGRAFRRGLSTVAMGEQRGCAADGMSPADIQRLPCYDFGGGGDTDCAVCLESFRSGERCRMLPLCRHSFHAQCVDCWLAKAPVCPICRTRASCDDGAKEEVVIGFPEHAHLTGVCCWGKLLMLFLR